MVRRGGTEAHLEDSISGLKIHLFQDPHGVLLDGLESVTIGPASRDGKLLGMSGPCWSPCLILTRMHREADPQTSPIRRLSSDRGVSVRLFSSPQPDVSKFRKKENSGIAASLSSIFRTSEIRSLRGVPSYPARQTAFCVDFLRPHHLHCFVKNDERLQADIVSHVSTSAETECSRVHHIIKNSQLPITI